MIYRYIFKSFTILHVVNLHDYKSFNSDRSIDLNIQSSIDVCFIIEQRYMIRGYSKKSVR